MSALRREDEAGLKSVSPRAPGQGERGMTDPVKILTNALEEVIAREMAARGFERQGGQWVHPQLAIRVRHKRARCWLTHHVKATPEEIADKFRGELDHVIQRRLP